MSRRRCEDRGARDQDGVHLGTDALVSGIMVLPNSFVGRPTIVPVTEIVRRTRAAEHDDAEDA